MKYGVMDLTDNRDDRLDYKLIDECGNKSYWTVWFPVSYERNLSTYKIGWHIKSYTGATMWLAAYSKFQYNIPIVLNLNIADPQVSIDKLMKLLLLK
jgi:hypothetical protein